MQITAVSPSSIASLNSSIAALSEVNANGRPQTVVVEHTASGYQAYLAGQPGPIASGATVSAAESRLSSTVDFNA